MERLERIEREGAWEKTDNICDQTADRPVSLSVPVACLCICVCKLPQSHHQLKGNLWSTDLKQIVFQSHHVKTSCTTTTVNMCGLPMVIIYHQLQRWAPPAPPIKGFCSRRGNLSIARLNGLSGPWTSSAHENCNQRIQSCQSKNLPVFFFFFFSATLMKVEAKLAWLGYECAPTADMHQADLSLSPFISCLACNHPVSAEAAAWWARHKIHRTWPNL